MKRIAITFHKPPVSPQQAILKAVNPPGNAVAAAGKVSAVYSELHSVDVLMDNGRTVFASQVLSTDWVTDNDGPVTGKRNLPPVGAYVIVMFPFGMDRPETTYVLGSLFFPLSDEPHLPQLSKNKGDEEYARSTGGWVEIVDRMTGKITMEHDEGIRVVLDPGGGVELNASGQKVAIANTAESLAALLGELIDGIAGLTTFGSPASHTLTPDAIAGFNALKTRFGALLK